MQQKERVGREREREKRERNTDQKAKDLSEKFPGVCSISSCFENWEK